MTPGKLFVRLLFSLFVALLCSGCPGGRAGNRIVVPIRPCIVKGSGWTRAPDPGPNRFPPPPWEGGYFYSEGTDEIDGKIREIVRRVNFEVWIPGAEIAFQPVFSNDHHFPVIDDPLPPGPANDVLHYGPGKFGDIEVNEDRSATTEMQYAQASCDWSWRRAGIKSNALVIIIASELVNRDGTPARSIGANPGHFDLLNRNERRDLCEVPRKITRDDIAKGYAIIVDPVLFLTERHDQGDPAITLAHELGHMLMLSHGDGVDNDGNGTLPPANGWRRFDEDCDSHEYISIDQGPSPPTPSLMGGGYIKTLTPLQVELARTAAVLAPEAVGGPP